MHKTAIAALSLAILVAAGGCTTNKVPGNGQPSSSPEVGSAGTAATPGSSSGTSGTATTPANPPMVSSSEDATATMAALQPHTARVLGPVDPGAASEAATAGATTPNATVYSQATVNSSIPSQSTPAIPSGAVAIDGAPGIVATSAGLITMNPTPATAGNVAPVPSAATAVPMNPTAASVGAPAAVASARARPASRTATSSNSIEVGANMNGVAVTNATTTSATTKTAAPSRFQRALRALRLKRAKAASEQKKQ